MLIMAIFTKPKLLFLFFLILSLFIASQCDEHNPQGQDPMQELERCLRVCRAHAETPDQQFRCQRSCAVRYEKQQREKSAADMIEDVLTTHHNPDPERIYKECQQRCEKQGHGQQRQLCEQRCEQEYRRQQQRGQETGEDNPGREGQREPERRFRECQQRCQKQEQGQQQRQCEQRCEQEFRREQERQHRGQEETIDENPGPEPERRFRECQQRCQKQEQGQQQRQCEQRCEQEFRREQERQHRGQEETIDENPGREPERRFRECQQRCQKQEQGQQQRQCEHRCEQEFKREQERQHRGQEETIDENPGPEPERRFRECQQRCQKQQGQQQRQCEQRCEQEFRRGQERQHRGQETENPQQDPEKRLRECQQRCQRQQQGQQQRQCQQRCQQEYRREQEQHGREDESNPQRQEENNPYLFESQSFQSRFRATHGDFRVLEKFTERSELLRGIENYRVAVLEFEPQSFMLPHHCDAEAIFVVVRGQGIISTAEQDEKNSFNLQCGDVIKVPAGSTVYFLNKDNNERFFLYMLAKPVNAPGRFQEYFSAGGENPESFYRAFSSDILETSFNTPRDSLERLFGQQKQGIVIKASEEQIRAISEHASRPTKQTKGETTGPFNLLKERPLFGSKFGQFFEASPERFEQLRDLDTAVAFMNINQGGMVLPFYNTRSTRLAMVVEGTARFEMACPHLGSQRQGQGSRGGRSEQEQEQEEGSVHYQKVRGTLNVGDVLVVPAGHPITIIATGGSNLRMVSFGINAHNNRKNFLAGKESIWKNVEREAKELSFNMPGKEVEQMLQKQEQSYFVAGPQQHRERGGEQYLSSILNFVF